MKNRKNLFVGLGLILVGAMGAFWLWPASEQSGTVTVNATPGSILSVVYVLDGETYRIEKEVPIEFGALGREFTCSISEPNAGGSISVQVVLPDGSLARTTGGDGKELECGFRTGDYRREGLYVWARSISVETLESS